MTKPRILLVEDDIALATSISEYITLEGFDVQIETDGAMAQSQIMSWEPDLVILDIMLPNKDGVSICREVRPFYQGFILMFTAKEDEVEQIVGLEVGADDYLIKPIKPRLLLAKIKSFLRRNTIVAGRTPCSTEEEIALGELRVLPNSRSVELAGVQIKITSAEFDLLCLLARQAGNIVTRDQIMQNTSGTNYDGLERTIDNKISILRKKLFDDARNPQKIKTIRSKGYMLVPGAFG